MIKLRLKFSNEKPREFDIVDGERLNDAVTRILDGVKTGKWKPEEAWLVVVNGYAIEGELWPTISLKEKDIVVVTPKIKSGDAGQIFKTAALIIVSVVAAAVLEQPEALGPIWGSIAVAGVTIGAGLLLNALIPPPVASVGDVSLGGDLSSSQMYNIDSQSNDVKRLDTVPKVYGTFRMFPNIAALPYTELSTSSGTYASALFDTVKLTAIEIGSIGNAIKVKFQAGGTAGREVVAVTESANESTITVTYEQGVSLASQIKAAIDAHDVASTLVSVSIASAVYNDGIITGGDTEQDYIGTQNLGDGTDAGETIQYLVAIYDFGLGTNVISDLQIGDTPITSDSFVDFNINIVDPAMGVALDQFDAGILRSFQYYKLKREIVALAVVLNDDGDENIQDTDPNGNNLPQELILDFECPRGLYGISSNGDVGPRNVDFQVEFAPIGTNDWQAWNDLNFVSSHQIIGGQENTEFDVAPVATVLVQPAWNDSSATEDDYYVGGEQRARVGQPTIVNRDYYFKKGSNKIPVDGTFTYPIGAKVYSGNYFLGNISSVDETTIAPNKILVMDRPMSTVDWQFKVYNLSTTYDIAMPPEAPNFWAPDGGTMPAGTVYGWWMPTLRIVSQASGVATITGSNTNPVYASIRFTPITVGQFQVRVRRIKSYGTWNASTSDEVTWGAITTAYAADPIATTNRHTFMELKIRATDQLNGNISTLSAVCSSVLPVYDPDTQTWTRQVTANPAWIFADLLTGQVNKLPIPVSKLDTDSIVEWAEFCDAVPTPPPDQTFIQPRFSANFVLDYQTTLQDLLAQLGGMAQASLNIINGKYGVLIDKLRTVPVQIFTPRNSRDFGSTRSYTANPDAVDITWIDPNNTWQNADITVYDDGFDSGTAVNIDALTAFACTNQEQAWRFGRYMIAQNRLRQENITILVDFEYLACTRGDYVQVVQDVMMAGGTAMRVKTVTGSTIVCDDSINIDPTQSYGYIFRGPDGTITATATLTATEPDTFVLSGTVPNVGDLIVVGVVGQIAIDCLVKSISPNDDTSATLILVEKADAIYTYESTDTFPPYDPQISDLTLSDSKPPNEVTNLIATTTTQCSVPQGTGVDYIVTLTWDIPAGSVYELFEIWVNDSTGYSSIATTKIKTYVFDVDPSKLDRPYGFKVVAVSATGAKLDLAAMATITTIVASKTLPPSDVQNFNVGITDQTLQLSWTPIDDCDAFQYVLRYSPDINNITWEASIDLATVKSDFNTFACQARTGTYFIKAIDSSGNASVNAGVAITTIPDLFDINDIETIDEAPTFEGELDQTALLGEAVILTEQVAGDINTVEYYTQGYYTFAELLDLGDIYTIRVQSLLQAIGVKKGEFMSDWTELSLVTELSTVTHDQWDVALEYRTSTEFDSMSDWTELGLVDHINFGGGEGFTNWREIPQVGDVTGRIFQFRVRLDSNAANVTPLVYDTTVNAYMPDRTESGDNIMSDDVVATTVTYSTSFAGPGSTPIVQISIDSAQTGDYWSFDTKALDGFAIRFYDKTGTQVARSFDFVAKGFGHNNAAVI